MKFLLAFYVAACALLAAVPTHAGTLDQVKSRGYLNCGSNQGLAGFGLPDNKGNWTGLDVDLCRALTAAIFDDASKVRFVPLTAQTRYMALQSREIDVLARNSTWTLANEINNSLLFTSTSYYDGQGFMVPGKLGIKGALELNGASVCVQQGTTSEANLLDYFRTNKIRFEGVVLPTLDETIKAYEAGRCKALTTDSSQLYVLRLKLNAPNDHMVLPEVISKEPLSPVVRQDDMVWFNIVKWTVNALINAEELGITKDNIDEQMKSRNPAVKRLLGTEGDFGTPLGLTKDWAARAIKAGGNYEEIFERNLGMGSSLKIQRGLNNLWNKGGLIYAPPFR